MKTDGKIIKSENIGLTNVTIVCGKASLKMYENGEIFVNDMLVENNIEVVEGMCDLIRNRKNINQISYFEIRDIMNECLRVDEKVKLFPMYLQDYFKNITQEEETIIKQMIDVFALNIHERLINGDTK